MEKVSYRKMIQGEKYRADRAYLTQAEALSYALSLQQEGYKTRVIKLHKKWVAFVRTTPDQGVFSCFTSNKKK